MIDRRLIRNFDIGILFVALAISLIGVMTIYSATRPVLDFEQQSFYLRQLNWIGLSLIAFFFVSSIDYRRALNWAYIYFGIGIFLLIIVLIAGRVGMGAQRWISIGFFSFQPSEFFKLFFVLAVSRYLSEMEETTELNLWRLAKITSIFLVLPAAFIIMQPDLGTALILIFIFLAMVMIFGIRKKIVAVAVIIGLISIPFIGNIAFQNLKGYQKYRIIAFLDPGVDPRGIGYHITQSKVTIGSGGFMGKGFQKGTQGPLRFLPERHTDFIFAIFAEEWGFIGSAFLFMLYLFIIVRGFDAARIASDKAGSYLAAGITSMFAFYFVINIAMTLGMAPVVGAPLPLMSYGGTALLSNFISLGFIESIRMRRSCLSY
jgi:rod shape determining protein RodA